MTTMIISANSLFVAVGVGVTLWVARTLSVAGRPFLVQVFHGNATTVDAVNQLLIVTLSL